MRVPKYCRHKATGQAFCKIKGQFVYLGAYGSDESRAEYERVIGEYLAGGRKETPKKARRNQLTVEHLCLAYLAFAENYYSPGEYSGQRSMTRRLIRVAGDSPASSLTPRVVELYREECIAAGNSRKYVNQQVQRMVAMVRWGVAKDMVKPDVWQRLKAVAPLKRGRTKAPDRPRIKPVPDELLDAAIECMPDEIADMLRLQRYTGMRPGEVWGLRPCDIDRSEDVWHYRPAKHKTEHHDRQRIVSLGPRAQAVLTPHLLRPADALCFTRDSGEPWDRHSYRQAVHKWCRLADLQTFNPYQIRHSVGTEVRGKYGLDGAQVVLGHSKADVTEIYTELEIEKADEIARRIG